MYQPLSIRYFETGLIKAIDDSLLPEDGFSVLNNAYVWRNKLIKKGGTFLLGRLGRRQESIAGAAGNTTYTPVEPGSLTYVEGGNTHVDTPTSTTAGTIAGGTITYATGAYAGLPFPGTLSYGVSVDEYSPVMGLYEREVEDINEEELIAFDRKMAYVFSGTDFTHSRYYVGAANTVEWTGTDYDFFYCDNYRSAFWATNGTPGLHGYAITNITQDANAVITIGAHSFDVNDIVHISGVQGMTEINGLSGTVTGTAANTITVNIDSAAFGAYAADGFAQALTHSTAASGDGIRWYAGNGWVNFAPPNSSDSATEYLQGCKFILPYKDRLIAFSTWEGATYAGVRQYPNRIRWCAALSTPFYANLYPTGESYTASVWYQEPGLGGYLDAPTSEHIVGVKYLKDSVIILFEQSTYILNYTGNRNLPFTFQRINNEFGCEASHSPISFDDQILSVGDRGIYGISTSGCSRIDDKIPDVAFEMQNSVNGTRRVHGIRDFFSEVVYWAYRDTDTIIQGKFPNRILYYNYKNDAWAIFNHSVTCFGNHITTVDVIWDNIDTIWDEYDVIWDDAKAQSNTPTTIAGNQQGYVFGVDWVGANTRNGNSQSLVIESTTIATPAVFTVTNHNLDAGAIVYLSGLTGSSELTDLNNNIFRVSTLNYAADELSLEYEDSTLVSLTAGEEYYGAGKITVLDNFSIVTKTYNPYVDSGQKARFGMIDILARCDDEAKISVETIIDKNPFTISNTSQQLTIATESEKQKWYRVFPQTTGQFISLLFQHPESFMFRLSDDDTALCRTGFDITSYMIWFALAGRNMR